MASDLERLASYLPALWAGTTTTVALTMASMAFASTLGLVLAMLQFSRAAIAVTPVRAYIAVIRNTPELVQLFFVFYSLPVLGIVLPPFPAAVLVFGLHFAAYLSEVYRGGIQSIADGQWEASRVLGLSRRTTWLKVILPQAFVRIVPPWGNYLLILFKATSIASTITVAELTYRAGDIAASNFRFFELFTLIALIYLLLSLPTSFALRRLERYMGRHTAAQEATV